MFLILNFSLLFFGKTNQVYGNNNNLVRKFDYHNKTIKDSISLIHLISFSGGNIKVDVNGFLMTDGNCKPSVLIGIIKCDTNWIDVLKEKSWSQNDCGLSYIFVNQETIELNLITLWERNFGNKIPLTTGEYKIVVMDVNMKTHCSESFFYSELANNKIQNSKPLYEKLCFDMINLKDSTIQISTPLLPKKKDSIVYYYFLFCYVFDGHQSIDLNSKNAMDILSKFYNNYHLEINNNSFSGCVKLAVLTHNRGISSNYSGYDIYEIFYKKGRVITKTILNDIIDIEKETKVDRFD